MKGETCKGEYLAGPGSPQVTFSVVLLGKSLVRLPGLLGGRGRSWSCAVSVEEQDG